MTTPQLNSTPVPSFVNGKKLYKVISAEGESQNSGSHKWSLPATDGTPGDWHEVAYVRMCSSGFHLTTTPTKWWPSETSRVFEVEAEGFQLAPDTGEILFASDDKVVARRCRLLREITDHADLATVGILRSGTHEVREGSVTASGDAKVTAYGDAKVTAYGGAQVTAYGGAKVTAYGGAKVTAYDRAQVTAYGGAKVTAYDRAQVTASGGAKVTAYGRSDISIPFSDCGCNKNVSVTLEGEACCVDRRKSGKPEFKVAT